MVGAVSEIGQAHALFVEQELYFIGRRLRGERGKIHRRRSGDLLFPRDLPENVSGNLAALRVKHLLTMSVGHAKDSTPIITKEQNWVKSFLSLPIYNAPGSTFLYNSGATYMLSAIVQKVSGKKAIDFLRPRLFDPLDISGMTWETCPRGINTGGWGLSVQTDALAKFGQLYLQDGIWDGRQLLPEPGLKRRRPSRFNNPRPDLEKAKQTSDWHQGYCYQFWRCRHNGFRGDGAFGQYCIVLPEKDAVVIITSETGDMQGELNLVWNHLLPAMATARCPPTSLRTRNCARSSLRWRCRLLPAEADSPICGRISGKTIQIESNAAGVQSVRFDFRNDACAFTLTDANGAYPIHCGLENGPTAKPTCPERPQK